MTDPGELLARILREFAESDIVDEHVVAELTRSMTERGVDISVEEAELVRLAVAITLTHLLETLTLSLSFDA